MPRAALGPVRLEFNGGGVAAFRKSSLPSADTSKVLYLQCLESFQVPFDLPLRGKCFSPHFPKQGMDLPAPRLRQAGVGSIPAAISNAVLS